MRKKNFFNFIFCCCSLSLGATELSEFKTMWTENNKAKRTAIQDTMQSIIDRTPKAEFDEFDETPNTRTSNPVLKFYDAALDRLLVDIPATEVKPGTVVIWYLYNMGFIIKTPESCFGVDIHHRRAVELADLVDFIAITHNHEDHYSMPLQHKMNDSGKLVITNFFPNPGYTKAAEYTHDLPGGITIHCGEANHNRKLQKFTMPMEIICKTGDKKFVFFTSGDCWSHEFLNRKSERIDLYAIHPRCGMKPVNAVTKLDPRLTFISHLQELGHEINRWRWQFSVGREELKNLDGINKAGYVPIWGEKFIWDGEKLTGCQK